MKIRKSRLLVLLVVSLAAFLFAVSPVWAAPRIGILIYKYDDTYISTVRNALTKAFDGKATITMQDGKGDQATQNDQLDVMIGKTDGIIVNMVDVQAASGVLERIKEAKVPVVFFNREPDLSLLKTYDKAYFIGTNAADAGKMQGDIIKELWTKHPEYDLNKDGKFQYVMFQGEPDNPEAIARTEWSVKQATVDGVTLEQIGKTFVCNWDAALAQQAMEATLAANEGKIELVIANNDGMALGAISALNAVGYNTGSGGKYILVIGVDATDQAVDAINKGIMSGTVKQDGEAMGQTVAAVMLNLVEGKAPLDGLNQQFDSSGVAVRIPYAPYLGK